jgi:nitroimidazol reductase NimA-like FMN-containing flavoprotein (pyridoxamine 5'-phosphate oxidase superfamily)
MSKQPTASTFMPLRGEKRWAYLTRQKSIRIATTNDDGSIYMSPLYYVVHDKRILLPVDAAGRHAENAQAGRALTALVDSGDEYGTVHGVRIHGTMKAILDPEIVDLVDELVFEKYFYTGHPYAESYFNYCVASGRQVFELVVDKMIGWDMREIALPAVPEAQVLPDFVTDRLL